MTFNESLQPVQLPSIAHGLGANGYIQSTLPQESSTRALTEHELNSVPIIQLKSGRDDRKNSLNASNRAKRPQRRQSKVCSNSTSRKSNSRNSTSSSTKSRRSHQDRSQFCPETIFPNNQVANMLVNLTAHHGATWKRRGSLYSDDVFACHARLPMGRVMRWHHLLLTFTPQPS
jgi:hypothetical protein